MTTFKLDPEIVTKKYDSFRQEAVANFIERWCEEAYYWENSPEHEHYFNTRWERWYWFEDRTFCKYLRKALSSFVPCGYRIRLGWWRSGVQTSIYKRKPWYSKVVIQIGLEY